MYRKIGFKLGLAVGITAILIIGTYSYYALRSQSRALVAEVEEHAHQLSETIKNSTHQYMLANHRDQLHETINAIGKHLGICGIRIFNKDGFIVYSAKAEEIGTPVDKRAESCYGCHLADQPIERLPIEERTRIFRLAEGSPRGLGVINPIYNEPACWEAACHAHPAEKSMLGVLDVTICLTNIDAQIQQSKIKGIIFAVISIVCITGILGVFLKKLVTDPVDELVSATNRVSMGDFSYTIENPGKDELGQLATSFNNMTSKLSAMRMQLFQSDKMASLGRLSAGIAHELNNPLTGVLTYSSFLLKRASGNPELKKDLEVIVRETKRSREIVKGLLDFARQSVPKKSEVNINDIIDRTFLVVKNQLKIHRIEVIRNIDPDIPDIRVDSNQIQQVFLNLVVNAIDAIGKTGGTITIASTILSLSPRGIMKIQSAQCPNKHNLIDTRHKIEGMPSIRVKTKYKGNVGFVHIDPLYGGQRHHYGIQLLKDAPMEIHCPECDVSLVHPTKKCPECGSTVYVLQTVDKGTIEGCTRHGGTWQSWARVDEEGKRKYIEVSVTDTGVGIPQDEINDIFEPFFSTKGQVGTGLGLSVIWGIVDNHGGTISVDSTVGQGTTFTVRLPTEVQPMAVS